MQHEFVGDGASASQAQRDYCCVLYQEIIIMLLNLFNEEMSCSLGRRGRRPLRLALYFSVLFNNCLVFLSNICFSFLDFYICI